MRKLTFKHVEEKNKKKKQWLIGGVLLFLMLLSVLGYAFQSLLVTNPSGNGISSIKYNGFEFFNQNGFWALNLNGSYLAFTNTPYQTENVVFNAKKINDYENKTLYIYSDDLNAESEIKSNMAGFVKGIENACPENANCTEFPAKTCDDNFIIIKNNQTGSITSKDDCVFIEGSDLTNLADEFLYRIFGIKQ